MKIPNSVMLLWKRYVIAGTIFLCYSLVTFYLILQDCPPLSQPKPQNQDNTGNNRNNRGSDTEKEVSNTENDEALPRAAVHRNIADDKELDVPSGIARDYSFSLNKTESKESKYTYDVDVLPYNKLLDTKYAPNLVFYVWCGRRWLEYNHYMSILSVIRIFRPDTLLFYFDSLPITDDWVYNTWYKELVETYPFFITTQLTPEDNGCNGFKQPNLDFIYNRLVKHGGVYMNEDVILDTYPVFYREYDFIYALTNGSKYGLIQTKKDTPVHSLLKNPLLPGFKTKRIKCKNISEYNISPTKTTCVDIPDLFFPKDIWELDTPFGRLVRRHFYGSPEINLPQKNNDVLIPNIAHIVWIGGGKMDFLFYLGVISLIYVAEVDIVYIHGDLPPSGSYWDRVKNNPKVKHIYREVPRTVFGTELNILSHITDVWRVDFMIKYGGIYIDTDVAFVKPLDHDIRAYDAVGTYDWTYWNHPFPDTINFGVAIGKRNAKYWQLFQESMRWFIDSDWSWNGLRQPYRIKERHPELVLINPHLQVTCFQFKCHPTWWQDYHNEQVHHLNSNSIKDWRNEIYAFHWTMPTPPELENEESLVSSDTMFADVGRYILHKAGVLKADNRTLVYPDGSTRKLKVKGDSQ